MTDRPKRWHTFLAVASGRHREREEPGVERLARGTVHVVADEVVADEFPRSGDLAQAFSPTLIRDRQVE